MKLEHTYFQTALFYALHIYTEQGWRSRYSDWLGAGRPRGRSSSPGRVKNFLRVIQTGSGAHPASYPMGTGGFFPGGRTAGA
jgi:hypothetical protein